MNVKTIQRYRIKESVLELIAKDADCKFSLHIALGKDHITIYRYVVNNNENLTKEAALRVIEKCTGLERKDILEKIK